MPRNGRICFGLSSLIWAFCFGLLFRFQLVAATNQFFEIDVIDAVTGRGVPLVELETVNHLRFITDSAGRIALNEPSFYGESIFFFVRSHGYEFPKDGFGFHGTRLQPRRGGRAELKVRRVNVAERLYRITGEGIYSDSFLLGDDLPLEHPLLNAQVYGQDSVQPVMFKGKIFWFWGDTQRASYPLGNFRMSGAVSELPNAGGLDPSRGINLHYFTNEDGFCKGMFPIEPKGDLVWSDGFMTLTNGSDQILLAHYERLKGLGKSLEHGLAIYNEKTEEFERRAIFDMREKWRAPHGHPVFVSENGKSYYYFGPAYSNVRIEAKLDSILDESQYEAWSCLENGPRSIDKNTSLNRDSSGKLLYRWTTNSIPIGSNEEKKLISLGLMKVSQAHFSPVDIETGKSILLHGGSVFYNEFRKKWIMIAVENFGTSVLGEIWCSEAAQPTGPWKQARKVVTHDTYSFYNPVHHPFFDQEGGRIIYFEGTYTAEFSGNKFPTPRYDYNQIMYRLDLSTPGLFAK